MRRTLILAVAGSLLVTSAVLADLPLPRNLKYVDPRVSFQGIDKHPDYVFHLRFLTFQGGPGGVPHRLLEVKDSNAFNLNASRRLIDMKLLAMERKEFDKRAKNDRSLKWLTDKTEGVLSAEVAPPSTTAPASVKEAPVTSYRVLLKEGKLTVELVPDKKPGAAAPAGREPFWVAGLGLSAGLVWLGLWFARRRDCVSG